ncbi:pyridoxamine 5'-phosphate oxidase family protein [Arthrobacter woluwensis]|uniref:pyridoxamine 5'-phosphate oxidase family protein n=1 Tax=Arthrobacter woluwensis TaxID=156980 RepID=UPI003818247F
MSNLDSSAVLEMMRKNRTPMLTTVSPDGRLHAHPMTIQQVEDDATVWFFIGFQGEQAGELRDSPEANLAFATRGEWLSVAGRVSFVEDRGKVQELWNDETAAWFQGGQNDPNLGLLRFSAESAQGWGVGGNKLGAVIELLKAKVAGAKPSAQTGTTEL